MCLVMAMSLDRGKMNVPFLPRMFDEKEPSRSISRVASYLFTTWNPGHGHLDVVKLTESPNKSVRSFNFPYCVKEAQLTRRGKLYRVEHRRHIAFDQLNHRETTLVKVYKGADRSIDRASK